MSEIKKIATRESYGNALVEVGKEHEDLIVLDADLAGATKTGIFKKAFPERHWDVGIAEANMTGIAAGLATCGKVPFISSFAMFAAGRNFEQVRNSIGYPHLNVKIGATHAGISVGEDGATHQCLEDIALMRSIPGMVVISPADDVEARAAVIAAYNYQCLVGHQAGGDDGDVVTGIGMPHHAGAGVVPQHPPIIETPSSTNFAPTSANSSGVVLYTVTPSSNSGNPAFGFAKTGT
jgi:transketolase C-terminal domain/subunit